ncbi:hypothetical protein AK830_g2117 [Neonectria ditissima]|uniref:Uncharacterized protein n=1 Tax=Neonectria ditissima TaxID=78410 RepID=A0A0P7BVK8_9HYPO|nr:hypothetical protein AK830_g2117 [Neonectria ditissima]
MDNYQDADGKAAQEERRRRCEQANPEIRERIKTKRAGRTIRDAEKKRERQRRERAAMEPSIPGRQAEAPHVTRTGTGIRQPAYPQHHAAPPLASHQQYLALPLAPPLAPPLVAPHYQYPAPPPVAPNYQYPTPPPTALPMASPLAFPLAASPMDGPALAHSMPQQTANGFVDPTYTDPTYFPQIGFSEHNAQSAYMPSVGLQTDQGFQYPGQFPSASAQLSYFPDQTQFADTNLYAASQHWEIPHSENWGPAPGMDVGMSGVAAANNGIDANNSSGTNSMSFPNNGDLMLEGLGDAYDEFLGFVDGAMLGMGDVNGNQANGNQVNGYYTDNMGYSYM